VPGGVLVYAGGRCAWMDLMDLENLDADAPIFDPEAFGPGGFRLRL
jgi:hypothetical protein